MVDTDSHQSVRSMVCDHTIPGSRGQTKKFVDERASEAIETSPPQIIPRDLLDEALDSEWGHEKLNQMVSQCRAGNRASFTLQH